MESKLGLNMELVEQARASAAKVADDTQQFIDQHTTVTVERAVCRLLGIDGVNDMDVPLPNVVVDHLMANSLLPAGAAWAIGNAMVETGKDPQGVAEAVNSGELDLSKIPAHSDAEIRAAITPVVNATMDRINKNVAKRNSYLKEWGDKEGPYLYIIVATGNIYEDIIQAKAGAKQGADIIAVIRTTGQSLLDMCLTALPPRASAAPMPLRRTSASCAPRWTRWARSSTATSGCATTAPVCVCLRSPLWALWSVWTLC